MRYQSRLLHSVQLVYRFFAGVTALSHLVFDVIVVLCLHFNVFISMLPLLLLLFVASTVNVVVV